MAPSTKFATLALALAVVVSGCSGDAEPPKPTEDTAPKFGPTAWEVAAPKDVKAGGTLRLAIDKIPANFNDRVDVGIDTEVAPIEPTRGSAIAIKADGTWQLDKDYADSVKIVDEDPQTIEVKLNDRAVWQDGKPIVADDMIAWWKALNGSDEAFDVRNAEGFDDIKIVKPGKDRFTYTVTFDKANADWPAYVYPGLPKSATASAKTFNSAFARKATPSNGPFVISTIAKDGVTATRNPRWWGAKPRLDKIEYRVIDPAKQAPEFVAGKLDALDIGQDQASYDVARKRDDTQVQRSGGVTWTHLTFNSSRGPLKDVKVRRAVASALDREAFSSQVNKPLGVKPQTQGSMILVPGQSGYRDEATPAIGYDVKEAEALLESAGYARGADGMMAKKGKKLELGLTVPSDTPANAARARLIQSSLESIGISVKLDTVPVARYFDDYVIPLNFEMVTFSWTGGPFEVASQQALFDPVDSGQNFTGIDNPKLDDLWDEANSELDPDKQAERITDIDRALFDYVPIVPIAVNPTVVVVDDDLVNFGASQFQHPDFTAVGFRK